MPEAAHSPARKGAAWAVHFSTAAGAAAGFMALIAIADHEWLRAFAWMGVTLFIDSVDGSFARLCKVKEVLPGFDGSLLDNIVDYFTYVIVPAFFLYESGIMPRGWGLAAVLVVTLASGYQFCQEDAKTEDHCFKGFPSYWNVVAVYLFMLPLSEWFNFAVVLLLALGVFIPARYLYPSRTRFLRPLNLLLSGVWGILMIMVLVKYPEDHKPFLRLSLLYVVYYGLMSLYLTVKKGVPGSQGDSRAQSRP